MPRKKKNEDPIEEEIEKKGKKGKKGKQPKEPEDDIEVKTITVEEAIALLAGEEKKGKKKVNPYKGMDIHERNLKDPEQFIFVVNHATYVAEKVNADSLRLNTIMGPYAYGSADMDGHLLLHSNLNREHAFRVFLHELGHVCVFMSDLTIFDEEEYRFNDESLSQFVSNNWETMETIVNDFRKSAFFHSFPELDI